MGAATDTLVEKIGSIPRIYIYLIVVAIFLVPLASPIGLPAVVTPETLDYYNTIEKVPKGGVVVFFVVDTTLGDIVPNEVATLRHLFRRAINDKVRVILIGQLAIDMCFGIMGYPDKEPFTKMTYGVDWVRFQPILGGEAPRFAYTKDIWTITPVDASGTPVSKIPLMTNVKSQADIDLAIDSTNGFDDYEMFIRIWWSVYKKPIMQCTGSKRAILAPYYPHQYVGYLAGTKSGAEYEILIGVKGLNTSFTDVQSLTVVFAVVLVVIGNVAYISKRPKSKVK